MTFPRTFEAFNIASLCLETSLRGGFLYGLTSWVLKVQPPKFIGLGLSLDKSESHKILWKAFF